MYIIGVDPGLGGALALLGYDLELIDIVDMPICPKSTTKNWVDVGKLSSRIRDWREYTRHGKLIVAVENVHAMPGQGVTSMFSFGDSLGALRATLICNNLAINWVSPKSWKKYFNLTNDKKAATAKACNLYPNHTDILITPRGRCLDGRAEAILIARYVANM